MRRRDFAIGLLLATGARAVRAQEPTKRRRIAIVISTGPVARINDPGSRYWQAFWDELRRLGDVEGQNLTVERYSGEGRPAGFADLAREVVSRNPEVIVAIAGPMPDLSRRRSARPPAQYRSSAPGLIPALERSRVWRDRAAT
jgi:putative ABC transport system substrate-binding protein